jgi:hypothetical protein
MKISGGKSGIRTDVVAVGHVLLYVQQMPSSLQPKKKAIL